MYVLVVKNNELILTTQAAALEFILAMAIVGGLITGSILRLPIFAQKTHNFEDEPNRHLLADERDQSINSMNVKSMT